MEFQLACLYQIPTIFSHVGDHSHLAATQLRNPSLLNFGLLPLDGRRYGYLALVHTSKAKYEDVALETGPLSGEDQSLGLSVSSAYLVRRSCVYVSGLRGGQPKLKSVGYAKGTSNGLQH